MNNVQALHQFWSGFGWTAYDASTVPSKDFEPAMPRITYEVLTSEFDYPVQLTASLWDRSYSWASVSEKADEIYAALGRGGMLLPYDGGAVWITRASPFSQRMSDPDDAIRRIVINVNAEFVSA